MPIAMIILLVISAIFILVGLVFSTYAFETGARREAIDITGNLLIILGTLLGVYFFYHQEIHIFIALVSSILYFLFSSMLSIAIIALILKNKT